MRTVSPSHNSSRHLVAGCAPQHLLDTRLPYYNLDTYTRRLAFYLFEMRSSSFLYCALNIGITPFPKANNMVFVNSNLAI